MTRWNYQRNFASRGPVDSRTLKSLVASGDVQPDDLVQKEGDTRWAPARNVKGLFQTKPYRSYVKPPADHWETQLEHLAQGDDYSPMFAKLNQVIQRQPSHATAIAFLGCLQCMQGDVAQAQDALNKVRQLDSANIGVWTLQAFIAQKKGDWQSVVMCCTQVIKRQKAPEHQMFMLRSLAYANLGQHTEAQQDIRLAEACGSDSVDVLFMKTSAAISSRNWPEAVASAQRLLQADPSHELGVKMLALAYFQTGQYKACEDAASRFLHASHADVNWYNIRAQARYHQRNLSGAMQDLNRALKIEPDNALLWGMAAVVAMQNSDRKACIQAASKAIKLEPDNAMLFIIRGNALLLDQNVVTAEADYDACLRIDPANAYAIFGKGMVSLFKAANGRSRSTQENHLDNATQCMNTAIAYEPDNDSFHQGEAAVNLLWKQLEQSQSHPHAPPPPGGDSNPVQDFFVDVLKDVTVEIITKLIFPF